MTDLSPIENHPFDTQNQNTENQFLSPFAYDAEFLPLVQNFVKGFEGEINSLKDFIGAENNRNVVYWSHRTKGTAATYGYPFLANIIHQIEIIAQDEHLNLMESQKLMDLIEALEKTHLSMMQALVKLEKK